MKRTIILILLVFAACGCGQNKRAESTSETGNESLTDSFAIRESYTSTIRPGEELELEKIYVDRFEYVGYNDQGDNFTIDVSKDGRIHGLVNNFLIPQIIFDLDLEPGDLLEIQWKIDSLIPAGDSELLWFVEYAEKITRMDSLYRAQMEYGELKNFEIYDRRDTIVQDLNGDSIVERVFFNDSENIVIADGKTNDETIFIAYDDEGCIDGWKDFDWVDFWGITNDSETWRMTFKEGPSGGIDLDSNEDVPLLYPSIFVQKYESGGGIITFNGEKYVWVHQND